MGSARRGGDAGHADSVDAMIHHLVSVWQRLVALVRRGRIGEEIDDEIAFHVAMRREELERGGVPPAEAERRARRQFGNVARLREDT